MQGLLCLYVFMPAHAVVCCACSPLLLCRRMDNAYVTWRNVSLTSNKAALSVFDLWFGDAWVDGARVVGNQVQAGSIWNFESFRGRFQQVCEACMLLTKFLQLQQAVCVTLQLPLQHTSSRPWQTLSLSCTLGVAAAHLMAPHLFECTALMRLILVADPVGREQGWHCPPQRPRWLGA